MNTITMMQVLSARSPRHHCWRGLRARAQSPETVAQLRAIIDEAFGRSQKQMV